MFYTQTNVSYDTAILNSSACMITWKILTTCQISLRTWIVFRPEAAVLTSTLNDYWHCIWNDHSHFHCYLSPLYTGNSNIWHGDQNGLGVIDIVWDYRHTYAERAAEIIKHWFVIVVFPGFCCVERDWNLYSWGRSRTAGTDSAKAPLGLLLCLRRVPRLLSPNPQQQNQRRKWRNRYVPISGITHIPAIRCITCPLREAARTGYAGFALRLTQNKANVCVYHR